MLAERALRHSRLQCLHRPQTRPQALLDSPLKGMLLSRYAQCALCEDVCHGRLISLVATAEYLLPLAKLDVLRYCQQRLWSNKADGLVQGFPRAKGRRSQQKGATAKKVAASEAGGAAAQPEQRPADLAAVIPTSMYEEAGAQPMAWDEAGAAQAGAQPAPAKAKRKAGRAAKAADRCSRALRCIISKLVLARQFVHAM